MKSEGYKVGDIYYHTECREYVVIVGHLKSGKVRARCWTRKGIGENTVFKPNLNMYARCLIPIVERKE
jgi:hypothetical protein